MKKLILILLIFIGCEAVYDEKDPEYCDTNYKCAGGVPYICNMVSNKWQELRGCTCNNVNDFIDCQ